MPERLLKITYHGAKKLNAYLRMPSNTLTVLRREIDMYLFQERELAQIEYRTYWIDSDSDEIEIINQNDYEIFLDKCASSMHLQIAAINVEEDVKQEKTKAGTAAAPLSADDPSNFVIHDGVECDSCGANPLIGFRYKCVQCRNFDLCQACESAHKHPEHLMVRMPTNNGPSVIDAYLSGPTAAHHRRSNRRFRSGQCPLFPEGAHAGTQTTPVAAAEAPREGRRDRRHSRRHGGVLSQFVEMMMNLPESNTTPTTSAAAAATPTPVSVPTSAATAPEAEEPIVAKKADTVQNAKKSEAQVDEPDVEKPMAAPRGPKEQTEQQAASAAAPTPVAAAAAPTPAAAAAASTPSVSTPTTPVISLEGLSQIVNPEYMRAGIEILNNFSEMFAKMIDPSEAAAFGCADTSMASSGGSTVSNKWEAGAETAPTFAVDTPEWRDSYLLAVQAKMAASVAAAEATAAATTAATAAATTAATAAATTAAAPAAPEPQAVPTPSDERRRSESLDQDWQMIDNNAAPIANVSSSDALINLNSGSNAAAAAVTTTTATSADASVSTVHDYVHLSQLLDQHFNEVQQREQATAHTQTSQVDTVSTSTSTTSVATNSTSTSTTGNQPTEERRPVLVYHTDERINAAVHAMMAMGFSNEGAWLTQLLESVEGNIPAALDIMHTSQSGRN